MVSYKHYQAIGYILVYIMKVFFATTLMTVI